MTTATYGSGIYGTDTYGPAATVGQQMKSMPLHAGS